LAACKTSGSNYENTGIFLIKKSKILQIKIKAIREREMLLLFTNKG
jgi:hypothetical protein